MGKRLAGTCYFKVDGQQLEPASRQKITQSPETK